MNTATRRALICSVPTFVRFCRAYQALDDDAQLVITDLARITDDTAFSQDAREYAAEMIVETLFPGD